MSKTTFMDEQLANKASLKTTLNINIFIGWITTLNEDLCLNSTSCACLSSEFYRGIRLWAFSCTNLIQHVRSQEFVAGFLVLASMVRFTKQIKLLKTFYTGYF